MGEALGGICYRSKSTTDKKGTGDSENGRWVKKKRGGSISGGRGSWKSAHTVGGTLKEKKKPNFQTGRKNAKGTESIRYKTSA